MSLQRTELQLLDEKLHFQQRDLMSRLARRVAGEVGMANRLLKTRRRRRERDLEHRRVVAAEAPGKKKKKLPRPRSYFGTRLRIR
jgi:hypothetical protein